jgi:L-fuculokinase
VSLPVAFVIADLGKTNKKLLLYGQKLECLASAKKRIDPYQKDGLEWENVEAFEKWLLSEVACWSASYDIKSICISAHGATMGLIGADEQEVMPVLSYTSKIDEQIMQEFSSQFGSPREVHQATSSPDLGIINLARQIFAIKKLYPQAWARVKSWMPYNSYLAWRLCGIKSCEISYMGNHSGLWGHQKNDWGVIAKELGVDALASNFVSAWENLGELKAELVTTYNIKSCPKILTGLHDSNAALLPYLIHGKDVVPTILSTGTWCLAMGAGSSLELSEEDLDMGAYHNINVFGEPVKTVGFTGGYEYGWWTEFLGDMPELNMHDIEVFLNSEATIIFPGIMGGSVFPKIKSGIYRNGEFFSGAKIIREQEVWKSRKKECACALNISLAIQATKAIQGVSQSDAPVVVEGGFINNNVFLELLVQLNPQRKIQISSLQEASAFGAGLAALAAYKNIDPMALADQFDLPLKTVTSPRKIKLNDYIDHYHSIRTSLENAL